MSDIASFWNVDEMFADWQKGLGELSPRGTISRLQYWTACLPTGWRALTMIMRIAIAAAGGGIPGRNPNWDPGCGCYGGKN